MTIQAVNFDMNGTTQGTNLVPLVKSDVQQGLDLLSIMIILKSTSSSSEPVQWLFILHDQAIVSSVFECQLLTPKLLAGVAIFIFIFTLNCSYYTTVLFLSLGNIPGVMM